MHKKSLPILLFLVVLAFPLLARSQSWSAEFGAPTAGNGLNSDVYSLFVYQDKLIAGGHFTQAGSVGANRIAAWDGIQWSALGSGFSFGSVYALAEYGGDLIAGGGDDTGSNGFLMRWNGANWLPLIPTGTTDTHYAMQSHAGLLYVNTRDASGSKLAWWDGSVWSNTLIPTDPFGGNFVTDMESYNGQLYLTGSASPGGPNIAYKGFLYSWIGEGFGGPGYVFDGYAGCLHVHDNLLFVCGAWNATAPIEKPNIAAWQGGSWMSPLANVDEAYGMDTFHGRLVVGTTSFHGAQEVPLMYDFPAVWTVKAFQDDLYVAGSFTSIRKLDFSSVSSYFVGKWTEPVTAVGEEPVVRNDLRVVCAPNPFNPSVNLTVAAPQKGRLIVVVYDATGRVVRHLFDGAVDAGERRLAWNGRSDSGSPLASGVYFAKARSGERTATARLVLLK